MFLQNGYHPSPSSQASFENWYYVSETLFHPRYLLHSPIYSACSIAFLFHFWYIPATEDVFFYSLNDKSLELNLKNKDGKY